MNDWIYVTHISLFLFLVLEWSAGCRKWADPRKTNSQAKCESSLVATLNLTAPYTVCLLAYVFGRQSTVERGAEKSHVSLTC